MCQSLDLFKVYRKLSQYIWVEKKLITKSGAKKLQILQNFLYLTFGQSEFRLPPPTENLNSKLRARKKSDGHSIALSDNLNTLFYFSSQIVLEHFISHSAETLQNGSKLCSDEPNSELNVLGEFSNNLKACRENLVKSRLATTLRMVFQQVNLVIN